MTTLSTEIFRIEVVTDYRVTSSGTGYVEFLAYAYDFDNRELAREYGDTREEAISKAFREVEEVLKPVRL